MGLYRIRTTAVVEARMITNGMHIGEHEMETGVISYAGLYTAIF